MLCQFEEPNNVPSREGPLLCMWHVNISKRATSISTSKIAIHGPVIQGQSPT